MMKVEKIRRSVIKGGGRGGKLGYPTANLELKPEDNIKRGVWATMVSIDGRDYSAATFVGAPASFDEKQEKIEVFIFDFAGDLYDKIVELDFVQWLRPVEKFADEGELVAQIEKDCQQARNILM
ncbi:MAG: riboflavin kinase [Parcubacteria group bacterium]